jgi:hypothetical protein
VPCVMLLEVAIKARPLVGRSELGDWLFREAAAFTYG